MVDFDLVPSEKQLTEAEASLKELGTSYEETYGFHDDDVKYAFKSEKGLTREMVRQISQMKNEPEWMTEFRLKAYDIFISKPMPTWGGDLTGMKSRQKSRKPLIAWASRKPSRSTCKA
jgi:hypothetical protein